MKEEMLKSYLDTMRFLSDAKEEMMYLCDLASEKIYFADNYAEKLQVAQMEGTVYTLEELQKFLYSRNGEKVFFRLDSFENLENGLLHQEYHLLDKQGKKYKVFSTERLQFDDKGNPMWIIGHISNFATSPKVDALTKLYNAKKLIEDLKECLDKKKKGCLIVLGIDNFKNINNKYGREFGDRVLKNIAETLDDYLALSLRAYRMDSDKFAINAVGCTRSEAEKIYQDIREKIANHITLSSGVTEYTEDLGEAADIIYQQAENALDLAKKNGKNKLEFFSKEVYKDLLLTIDFQEELKKSVSENCSGFSICYQPQIDLDTCRIYGVEALLRYHSAIKGNVSPTEFIPVLEQTELIIEVGEWVLRNALLQCKKWRTVLPDLCVNVNLSFVQLRDPNFLTYTLNLLEELELPGEVLTLELTESVHLQDYQFFNKIFYKLGKKGVNIAIDDFGTGYSSLGYIKSIAIDEIKIDRSFVSGIQNSAYNYRLLSNLIELAHSADIRVCCEGVETVAEFHTLKELNPDILQGYLFAKPLSVEDFEARYIKKEDAEYIKTKQYEIELFGQENQNHDSDIRNTARNEKIAAIIDRMEEIVYVSDCESRELLYLNAAGRELTGMYDYKGRKCYEVLHNGTEPCDFCQRKYINNLEYYVWEWENTYLKRHFLMKEKMIQWMGRKSCLTVCIDITEKEIMSREVQEKLEFEKNIVSCTKMLINEPDRSKAIDGVLELIGTYYKAKKVFICNIEKGWENTYEWSSSGEHRTEAGDLLEKIPPMIANNWRKAFQKLESFVIEDVEYIREIAPTGYQCLKGMGIKNLIVAPVRKNKDIVGFIIVDEPKKHRKDSAQLETMAYFLADRLLRDDTKERLEALLSLQHMRQAEMYNAILSETVAFAEIDLETGKMLDCGGLWKDYMTCSYFHNRDYKEMLTYYADKLIDPIDKNVYCQFFDFVKIGNVTPETKTRRLQFRREIDGIMQWVEMTAHVFSENYSKNQYALIYLKNIDAEKKQKLLQEEATSKDPLTGVYNRNAFEEKVKEHMAQTTKECFSTLIMLDCDNFKSINDRYGHIEGDIVLRQLADVLKKTFRENDLIGRLGGDEFLIFLKDMSNRDVVIKRINEFRDSFIAINRYESTCSFGIEMVSSREFSYQESIKHVDDALYQSKKKGRDCYSFYGI